ncbi:MAG: hypothetical protein ABIO65_13095 [Nitrospiria bacterium]
MRFRIGWVITALIGLGAMGGPNWVLATDEFRPDQPFPERHLPNKGAEDEGASLLFNMASTQQQLLVMLSDLTKMVKTQAADSQSQAQADQILAQIEMMKGRLHQMVERMDPQFRRDRAGSPSRP